jgi:hypothetical protein
VSNLSEIGSILWDYKLSLAPVLTTYVLFDFPALIRRITKIAYVPIYFVFFPSGHSDQLYAQYFDEDYMYREGEGMSAHEKRALRHRLQANAIFSMFFAAIFAPWLCGLLSALYLNPAQFFEFLVFLIVVKAIVLVWVLYKLRFESSAARKAFAPVCAMYIFYLMLVARGLTQSFEWTSVKLQSSGIFGVLRGLLDFGYSDFFINVIIVGAVTWGLTTLFAHPANIPEKVTDIE